MGNYVVEYEICALMFLLIVSVRFFVIRKFPSRLNKLFGIILICSICDITLDILGSHTIERVEHMPLSINYVINMLFYAMQITMSLLVLIYVLNMCGKWKTKYVWAWFIPSTIGLALLFTNPWTRLFFTFEKTANGIVFLHGGLFNLLYFVSVTYMVLTVITVFINRKVLKETEILTIVSFVTIILLSIIIQLLLPKVLLTGVALSASILMMFFTMQNPESMLDNISGVFNFGALHEYLRVQVLENKALWLNAVDVGGIRRINGAYGIRAGNEILRQVGDYLNGICKGKAMAFQMIGTKFIIISYNESVHNEITQSISARFKEPWNFDDKNISLIATVRFTDNALRFTSVEDVINLIDVAYSKVAGEDYGSTRQIDEKLLALSKRKMQVEEAIRRTLVSGEGFTLKYQPIYSTKNKKYCSAEVLLRMTDEKLGSVSPAEFIPIAENVGLIHQIDCLVLEKASKFFKAHAELMQCGFSLLEINLSATEFYRNAEELAKTILSKVENFEHQICIEVTETAATIHREILLQFMQKLIGCGVSFALDDFGTGYANINQLVDLPFSIVKIDKSFINSPQEKEKIILEDMAKMFGRVGLKTIIEGVETKEQCEVSTKIGIDEIQGNYFSVPLSEAEFVEFILKENLTNNA